MSKDGLSIYLTVNGSEYQLPAGIKLYDALDKLGLQAQLVAIEYNGEILHRHLWSEQVLQDGDHLEIVTIVGGG